MQEKKIRKKRRKFRGKAKIEKNVYFFVVAAAAACRCLVENVTLHI